jgi:cytochrome c556
MGRLRMLLTVALAVSALAVATVAIPASASVPAANTAKFCKPLKGISNKLKAASSGSSKYGANVFKKFAAVLRSSAKYGPTKVKKSGKTLAAYYSALGGDGSIGSINTTKLTSAIGIYFGYMAAHCRT